MIIEASNILHQYFDAIEIITIEQLNIGLINQTFDVNTNKGRFILQRINKGVFVNISALLNNKIKVTKFLSEKGFPVSNLILSLKNEYHIEYQDEVWHLTRYIESRTIVRMNKKTAVQSGRLIAEFHKVLLDFPLSELELTIPDFHNTIKRYAALMDCSKRTDQDKFFQIENEIQFLENYYPLISPLAILIADGLMPIRVVHNDTKISNMLFDSSDNAICLIDFDTLMPGTILSDIGDAMRSGSNESDENERDLNQVKFNSEIYEAFMNSYIKVAGQFLSPIEKQHLHYALPLILFEQACRFLTDFCLGNIYYPISYSTQNLDRARTQIKMLKEFSTYLEVAKPVIEK